MKEVNVTTGYGIITFSDGTIMKNVCDSSVMVIDDDSEYESLSKGEFDSYEIKKYNAARFLASCAIDQSMQAIFSKLNDRQYFDLAMCLQNSNFEMLQYIIGSLVESEVISVADVSAFATKLESEEGVSL